MKKKIFLSVALLGIGFLGLIDVAYSHPPLLNLTCEKNALTAYYNDLKPNESEYLKDVQTVIDKAEAYMNQKVPATMDKQSVEAHKYAMVLDIDDTSLSNYPTIKARDFSSSHSQIDETYHTTTSPAVAPVLALYNKAIQKGITVFFITGRKLESRNPLSEDISPFTIQTLHNAGFNGEILLDKNLYMAHNEEDVKLHSSEYKTKIRHKLMSEGYILLVNIGDQDSDFEDSNPRQEGNFKVPNYLYTTSSTLCDQSTLCAQ